MLELDCTGPADSDSFYLTVSWGLGGKQPVGGQQTATHQLGSPSLRLFNSVHPMLKCGCPHDNT